MSADQQQHQQMMMQQQQQQGGQLASGDLSAVAATLAPVLSAPGRAPVATPLHEKMQDPHFSQLMATWPEQLRRYAKRPQARRRGSSELNETERWYCLTEDHEVLTNRGFLSLRALFAEMAQLPSVHLRMDEADRHDLAGLAAGSARTPAAAAIQGKQQSVGQEPFKIASFDPQTDQLVYQAPLALTVKTVHQLVEFTESTEAVRWSDEADMYGRAPEHKGDIALARSSGVSLVVDPQHDMYARVVPAGRQAPEPFRKICADALTAYDGVQFTGMAIGGVQTDKERLSVMDALDLTTEEQMSAFLEVYGYWLGVGALSAHPRAVEFALKESQDKAWLEQRLQTIGLEQNDHYAVHRQADDQLTIVVRDPRWVSQYEEAADDAKSFADWVWRLSKSQLRLVLSGLCLADGRASPAESEIHTSSTRLRDDIVRAALHAGYSARFVANQEDAQSASWRVLYTDQSAAQPTLTVKTDVRRLAPAGGARVWCPSLPLGFIVARRVGWDASGSLVLKASRPLLVGNCPLQCGKYYKTTSTRSIAKHKGNCPKLPISTHHHNQHTGFQKDAQPSQRSAATTATALNPSAANALATAAAMGLLRIPPGSGPILPFPFPMLNPQLMLQILQNNPQANASLAAAAAQQAQQQQQQQQQQAQQQQQQQQQQQHQNNSPQHGPQHGGEVPSLPHSKNIDFEDQE